MFEIEKYTKTIPNEQIEQHSTDEIIVFTYQEQPKDLTKWAIYDFEGDGNLYIYQKNIFVIRNGEEKEVMLYRKIQN